MISTGCPIKEVIRSKTFLYPVGVQMPAKIQRRRIKYLTIVCAGDVVCDLVARLAALTEHGQLLVQHPLELVGRHVRDTLVGLETLQLVQTPVQLLQRLHCQPHTGSII